MVAHPVIAKRYSYKKGGLEPDISEEIETSADNAGEVFKVQVGAFRQNHKIKDIPEHSTIVVNDVTKHFSGNFSSYEEAAVRKKLMIQQGFKDAFIVSFPDSRATSSKTHVCKNWWYCLARIIKN